MRSRRAVLIGAGHAHLFCLRHCAEFAIRGHELVLIAPGPFRYSGMATGVLGGAYPPGAATIDVERLATQGGATVIKGYAARIDRAARAVVLSDGRTFGYDALSLDVGSAPAPLPGESEHPEMCFAVKPIERLFELKLEILKRLRTATSLRVAIAGGGSSAFEVAANLLSLARKAGGDVQIDVIAGGEPLRELPRAAVRSLKKHLLRRGARIFAGQRVTGLEEGGVRTEAGALHPCDIFVNATGLVPHPLAEESGLPVREGAMQVDAFLRSIADPRIHGGGDCIAFEGRRLPRAGVYAVRQAPILSRNLLASLERRAPEEYRPQGRHLAIVNLGDGTGLAAWGGLWWRGRLALLLKDRIDRRFVAD